MTIHEAVVSDTSRADSAITPPSLRLCFQVLLPLYSWPEIRIMGKDTRGASTIRKATSTDSNPARARTGTISRAGKLIYPGGGPSERVLKKNRVHGKK